MPVQETCLGCGAGKGIETVVVFDASDPWSVTYREEPYCPKCIRKGKLRCRKHRVLKTYLLELALDEGEEDGIEGEAYGETIEDDEEENAEEEPPSLVASEACPMCVRDAARSILRSERERLAALVGVLDDLEIMSVHAAFARRDGILRGMRVADKVVFGLALKARFYDLTPQELLFELFVERGAAGWAMH